MGLSGPDSQGTWKCSLHLHQNPVWGDSAPSVIDKQHLPFPSECPRSFCMSLVLPRAVSWAAAAFHRDRPIPGFSPGSHLPGLNFLSVITNIKKTKEIRLKDTGWRRKLILCHQQLCCLFVTAGLLRATDKKNKTQLGLYSSRVLWLPNRLLLLKRKYNITLSLMLF